MSGLGIKQKRIPGLSPWLSTDKGSKLSERSAKNYKLTDPVVENISRGKSKAKLQGALSFAFFSLMAS